MNKIKFTAIGCVLALAVINVVMLTVTAADEPLAQIGYGRGGRMQSGSVSKHGDEPIQQIPISFDWDSAKIELGKKLFFEPRLSK